MKMIIFHLMTSGAKVVDLRSNAIEKNYWGMKRAIRYFLFFLAIVLLELMPIICKKKSPFSQNLAFGDLWGPQY